MLSGCSLMLKKQQTAPTRIDQVLASVKTGGYSNLIALLFVFRHTRAVATQTHRRNRMKIELKNVKYAAFASAETNCFQATVYIKWQGLEMGKDESVRV